MAKLKDISAHVDSRHATSGVNNSQTVTAVEDIDMFNNVMDVADSASTHNEEQQPEGESQKEDSGQVKASDKNSETKDGEEIKSEDDKVKLSEQEQSEIDDQKVNVQELARQLNVMLDKIAQPVQPIQVQLPKGAFGKTLIAEKIDGEQTVEVDPELIKKVDVKTLREQMELAMKSTSGPDTFPEVPEDLKKKVQDNLPKVVQEVLPQNIQTTATKRESDALQKEMLLDQVNRQVQLNADAKDVQQTETDHAESTEIAEFLKVEKPQVQLSKEELPLPVSDGPDIVLNVVAAYADVDSVFERLTEMRDADQKSPLLDLINNQESPLHKDDVMSLIADHLVKSTSNQHAGQGLQVQQLGQGTQSPQTFPVQVLGETMMQPVMQKITNIIMNMSRDGRSGITRVQIYPPELGSVNIKFQMKDGSVKAEIIAEQEVTKRIIEKSLPELKDIFSKDNINVDSFVVKHSKEHFETPQQKMVTDFAMEKHHQEHARQGSSYNREAKSEQMKRLHNMIAERRALQSPNRFEVTV